MSNTELPRERLFDREARRHDPRFWCARSRAGMVSSAHYLASRAGARILAAGGNAIDAAVATSFALAVVEPAASGLGGMAMATVHLDGRTFAVLGPCRAPVTARPEELAADRLAKHGYRLVAVPTHVATMAHLLGRYGSKSVAEVLAPAIELAEAGYPITVLASHLLREYLGAVRAGNHGGVLLTEDGRPLPVGTVLRQPALARTLRRLAEAGLEDFYGGEIGRTIVADMAANRGVVSAVDLVEMPAPTEAEPMTIDVFGDWHVATLGPPAGGLTLLQILSGLDALGADEGASEEAEASALLAHVIRRSRRDRRRHRLARLAPGETPEVLTRAHAEEMARDARRDVLGLGETTHLTVFDGAGNAIAMTQSIERVFGAKVATPELGFLYNGYIKGFKVKNRRHPHYLQPGAVARSNAAPTLVLRGGRPYAGIGATGSERMNSAIAQVLLRLRLGQSPFEAMHAPRLHATPESLVQIEALRFAPATLDLLERLGFQLVALAPYAFQMGGVHLVVRDGDDLVGVAEPRRDGAAMAPEQVAGD